MTPSANKSEVPKTREEIAHAEIGVTDISPAVKWALTVFFLALIILVPVADQWAAYRSTGAVPVLEAVRIPLALLNWPEERKAKGLFDSAATVNDEMLSRILTFERDIEDTSALAEYLLPPVQNLIIARLRASSESAYVGRDGWLYFRPDLDYLTGHGFLDPKRLTARARAGNVQPDPMKAMVDFRDRLRARGIELIVFPVPTKPMIYPEHFSDRYKGDTALQNPSYAELRARLETAEIRVFDPTDALMNVKKTSDEALYLATDTHWTPHGLDVTAKALAQFVADSGIVARGESPGYTRTPAEVRNTGDVGVMLKLPEHQKLFTPETVTVAQITTNSGAPWQPSADAEILLLGDSFSNIFSLEGMGWGTHAGLAEQLSAELNMPLDTILINDAGAYVTREQLSRELRRGNDRLAGKKVVIWEFAMRELASGDWKLLEYDAAATAAPADNRYTSSRVTGVITALTHPPRPGSVPYKDCVVALHVTQLQASDGGTAPTEAVVFVWGMRDGVWTEWARAEAGDAFNGDLVPWELAEGQYGSYNRIELTDDALLQLATFWMKSDDDPASVDTTTTNAPPTTPAPTTVVAAATTLPEIVASLETSGANVWSGLDGWLYLPAELRHLSVGPFWGSNAVTVTRADNPELADPLPAIVDFSDQLKRAGIELYVMPVPPKAVIYPETVATGFNAEALDANLQAFYAALREKGVTVFDLTTLFRDRRETGELLYCKQDSHWTSAACAVAAEGIALSLQGSDWLAGDSALQTSITRQDTEIEGDLWRMLGDMQRPKETIPMLRVADAAGTPVPADRASPVLLLGDSHTLVFSEGADLYEANAGLRDHLAHELKMPVDVVGVRGSGSTPARINLLRRRDNLAGKKIVIWCFAAREFTESASGWRILPIITPPAQ